MKSNLYLFAGLVLLVTGLATPSFGNSAESSSSDAVTAVENAETGEFGNTVAHDPWYFLGCVHNDNPQHECEHLAHGYGYHHHFVRHDHLRCTDHHHSNACYGRN